MNEQRQTKPPKHYAVLSSPRRQTYSCPTCGFLGTIHDATVHSIRFQFDLTGRTPELPSNG